MFEIYRNCVYYSGRWTIRSTILEEPKHDLPPLSYAVEWTKGKCSVSLVHGELKALFLFDELEDGGSRVTSFTRNGNETVKRTSDMDTDCFISSLTGVSLRFAQLVPRVFFMSLDFPEVWGTTKTDEFVSSASKHDYSALLNSDGRLMKLQYKVKDFWVLVEEDIQAFL